MPVTPQLTAYTMGLIHDTDPGCWSVYLTWVLAAPRAPEPHTHADAIPHRLLVKELLVSDWSVWTKSRVLIGSSWTHLSPGSRQWVIISAFGLDLAGMPNINRIHRLVQEEEWNNTIVFSSESVCVGSLCLSRLPKWLGDPGIKF